MPSKRGHDDLGEAGAELPASLPDTDRELWNGMTAAQRRRAADRLDAVEKWNAGAVSIESAVGSTGLSRSHFYRMAAEWRSAPSLRVLGSFAVGGGTRSRLDPVAVNALQAVVARVVRMNAGATVKELVERMVAAADVPEGADMPGISKLRAIVEAEQRRVAASGEAGGALRLDCSAINLPREGGRPFVMFAILDEGTRMILGAAVKEEPEAVSGYRLAALDAQARLERVGARLSWAVRLLRMEVTAGVDDEASVELVERLSERGTGVKPQLARVPRRFGRYFRAVVGMRVGRVEITPLRTLQGSAAPDNGDMTPWTPAEAAEALRLGVESHNETVLAEMAAVERRRVPEGLERVLEILASP